MALKTTTILSICILIHCLSITAHTQSSSVTDKTDSFIDSTDPTIDSSLTPIDSILHLCHRPDRIRVFNALDIDNFNWSLRADSRDPDRKFSVVLSSYHHETIVNEKSSEHSGSAITTAIERFCTDNNGALGEYNFE